MSDLEKRAIQMIEASTGICALFTSTSVYVGPGNQPINYLRSRVA